MTPEQARAARAILKIGVRDVAQKVGVTPNTVSRLENGSESSGRGPQATTVAAIKGWYQDQGISFLDDDGSLGPGVRVATEL